MALASRRGRDGGRKELFEWQGLDPARAVQPFSHTHRSLQFAHAFLNHELMSFVFLVRLRHRER
jgi:hypothetical protein